MNEWGFVFCGVCLAGALGFGLWQRRKSRKLLERLDRMLTEAMDGDFHETDFDETLLSALETRLCHYLSASAVSAKNLSEEKARIKALISDISHQTKTPVANLMLYSELLQEETLCGPAAEYAATLHAQAEKLRFLIDSLVKLSRLENGVIALHPKKGPVWPMLQSAVRQFEPKARQKGLALQLEETAAAACFDEKWTGEALCNLLDNAIKYTQTGTVQVRVVPYEMFVCIQVIDTGPGIPEENQAKIFSRFYRAEENAGQEGVGIGLYLAREILKSEGGYIKVRSQTGKGSEFSLFLPMQDEIFQSC